MALTVPITSQMVADVWRPLSELEASLINGLAAQAIIRLEAAVRTLEADYTAGKVTTAQIESALISMIVRVLKNPNAVRQYSNTYDDWSESKTIDSAVSTGELYASQAEIDLVTPQVEYFDRGMYNLSLGGL